MKKNNLKIFLEKAIRQRRSLMESGKSRIDPDGMAQFMKDLEYWLSFSSPDFKSIISRKGDMLYKMIPPSWMNIYYDEINTIK